MIKSLFGYKHTSMQIKNSRIFASKVILFQETLKLKNTITCYYGQQQSMVIQGCVPSPQVWDVAQTLYNTLRLLLTNVLLTKIEVIGYCLMCLLLQFL
jgi:hypothetical protein